MQSKTELYNKIESEGVAYYFTEYGPEKPENVPEDIRPLWEEVTTLARQFLTAADDLMYQLEEAYNEDEDTFA